MLRAVTLSSSLCAALLLPLPPAAALHPAGSEAGAEAARRAFSALPSDTGDDGSAHYVLHFGSGAPPHHHLAAALGSSHVQPLGGGRLEVHASPRALRRALADGRWGLHRAEPMLPCRKLHSALRSSAAFRRRGAALSAANASAPRALVAVVSGAVDAEGLRAALEARGVLVRAMRHVRQQVHFALRNPEQAPRAARLLAGRDEVRWLEPRGALRALSHNESVERENPGKQHLWDHGIAGAGEIVQVGDTGLDYDSCFFRDDSQAVAFWPNTSMNHRKVVGYKECVRPHDLRRFHEDRVEGHGTGMCGIIVGEPRGKGSQSSSMGFAYKARIHFTDMACDEPDLGLPIDMKDYFDVGREVGARVSSISWGMDGAPATYMALDRELDKYAYNHQDFLVVAATGVHRDDGIGSPSNAKNALTVGAHKYDFHSNAVLSFVSSAVGPTWDRRRKPEVLAPGGPVRSARSDGPRNGRQCSEWSFTGTDVAAAVVSGAALLLREYFRKGWHPSGTQRAVDAFEPTAPLLKALIIHSAQRVPRHGPTPPTNRQGFGRLDLRYVTHFAADYAANHMLLVNNASVRNEAAFSKCFSVDPAAEARVHGVRATLVWMDPPPPEGVNRTMVNDLDLTLHTWDGGMLKPRGTDVDEGEDVDYDTGNLAEQVTDWFPGAGVYRATVFGHRVLEHAPYAHGLPFALAISAPGIREVPCSEAVCPRWCGGAHGGCDNASKMCRCNGDWIHQDCSRCSAAYCHGHGQCDPVPAGGDNMQCTCDGHFTGPRCAGCVAGWFGPDCAGDCNADTQLCGSRGHCDRQSGQCVCLDSEEDGHWGGRHCEICKDGWRGRSCQTPSYWCRNHQLVTIVNDTHGWLQVNGYNHYSNSLSCRYHIHSPNGHPIMILLRHNVEDSYDFISVFRGTDRNGERLRYVTGDGLLSIVVDGGDAFVLFESDMYDEGGQHGFTAEFTILAGIPSTSLVPTSTATATASRTTTATAIRTATATASRTATATASRTATATASRSATATASRTATATARSTATATAVATVSPTTTATATRPISETSTLADAPGDTNGTDSPAASPLALSVVLVNVTVDGLLWDVLRHQIAHAAGIPPGAVLVAWWCPFSACAGGCPVTDAERLSRGCQNEGGGAGRRTRPQQDHVEERIVVHVELEGWPAGGSAVAIDRLRDALLADKILRAVGLVDVIAGRVPPPSDPEYETTPSGEGAPTAAGATWGDAGTERGRLPDSVIVLFFIVGLAVVLVVAFAVWHRCRRAAAASSPAPEASGAAPPSRRSSQGLPEELGPIFAAPAPTPSDLPDSEEH